MKIVSYQLLLCIFFICVFSFSVPLCAGDDLNDRVKVIQVAPERAAAFTKRENETKRRSEICDVYVSSKKFRIHLESQGYELVLGYELKMSTGVGSLPGTSLARIQFPTKEGEEITCSFYVRGK